MHQFVVRALGDEPAVFQHQDEAGVDDRRDAFGHDDHRGPARERGKGLAEPGVRCMVQGREAVVKKVDRGVTEQCAGNAQPLALAAGKIGSALAHRGVQTVGQVAHEILGLGGTERAQRSSSLASGSRNPQVLGNSTGKEVGVLGHDGDEAVPQEMQRQ